YSRNSLSRCVLKSYKPPLIIRSGGRTCLVCRQNRLGPVQFIPERPLTNAEQLGGAGAIAASRGQSPIDRIALERVQIEGVGRGRCGCRWSAGEIDEVMRFERVVARENHSTLDGVRQLADVAGPLVGRQELHRRR